MTQEQEGRVLRSIMRSGGSLVVSLPRSWVEAIGLGEGDYLVVEIAGNSLIISPTGVERESEVKLRFESDTRSLVDKIVAAYLMGYDSMRINFPRHVKEVLESELFYLKERLMGLEIVESAESTLLLRMVIDPLELKPSEVLRRMWKLSDDMLRYSFSPAGDKGLETSGLLEKIEDDMDRLYFYMVRILRKSLANPALAVLLGLTSVEILDYRLAAYFLENIADKAFEVSGLISGGGKAAESALHAGKVSEILLANHKLAMEAFLNRRLEVIPQMKKNLEILTKLLTPPKLAVEQLRIRDAVLGIADMQYDIANLAIPRLA
ncbi:MAG: phosphate uptake regulator PhoU [Nitrososphaerota archaeon]